MIENLNNFEQRKKDHIHHALNIENQTSHLNNFDKISLVHEALPDLNYQDIEIASKRFGKIVQKPFFISSMTAGHKDAARINHNFLAACSKYSWAMGVGSQRRELMDENAALEWQTLRTKFSGVQLFANIGIAQLITCSLAKIKALVDNIQACGIIIHLNALQECIQPEGTPNFKGAELALEKLITTCEVPVIVKETGCGFSYNTLKRLNNLGVAAVDVSGAGGTHWGRIETSRSKDKLGKCFANWGIDTVSCLRSAAKLKPTYEIWGSGGIRSGLDAAKAIALGASSIGFAKIFLAAGLEKDETAVCSIMRNIEQELTTAMFCSNSSNLSELRGKISDEY